MSIKQTNNSKTNVSGCEESRGNLLLTEVASRLYHYSKCSTVVQRTGVYVCVCVGFINVLWGCFRETACQFCGLITISSLYGSIITKWLIIEVKSKMGLQREILTCEMETRSASCKQWREGVVCWGGGHSNRIHSVCLEKWLTCHWCLCFVQEQKKNPKPIG